MKPNKKQQLLDIVKKAQLPLGIEKLMVEDIEKQQDVTDEYILTVADTLERLGVYFKTVGEVQLEYLDAVVAEAQKVGDAMSVLNSLADQIDSEDLSEQPQSTMAGEVVEQEKILKQLKEAANSAPVAVAR